MSTYGDRLTALDDAALFAETVTAARLELGGHRVCGGCLDQCFWECSERGARAMWEAAVESVRQERRAAAGRVGP